MFYNRSLDSIKKGNANHVVRSYQRQRHMWSFTREVAETKSMHINNFAQQNEHPLISEIEPAEDE